MDQIKIDKIFFSYTNSAKNHKVFEDLSLSIKKGEFIAILGPSGCGKTTLLNCILGFLTPRKGKILISKNVRDKIAFVFQEPLLLPWLKVLGNVKFGLDIKRVDKGSADKKARDMLSLVHLSEYENHFPNRLSQGMKQRVNLARALSVEPKILLLDEPFSNLDLKTKQKLAADLLSIYKKLKNTFIFTTHDISEAVFLADRILIFSKQGELIRDLKNRKNKKFENELKTILK